MNQVAKVTLEVANDGYPAGQCFGLIFRLTDLHLPQNFKSLNVINKNSCRVHTVETLKCKTLMI